MTRTRYLVPLAIAAGPALFAGCGGGDTAPTPGTTPGGDGGTPAASGTVVIYTPNEEGMLNALIPAFEAATGVKAEIVTAGTGELAQRIRSEAARPQGDVMFGGGVAQAAINDDLWEAYTSANDADMLELGKNINGNITPYQADGSNLLVNTDKIGDLVIEGYADLLQPELKGKIAFGDATQSSSAFAQLTNMLNAMGGGDLNSDAGWTFVEQLVTQLDGKVIGSSSQVGQDTANGEYLVGLTYEPLSLNLVNAGLPVKIVYPKEGAVFLPAGMQLIKGGPNPEAGKAFIDFITSEEGQTILANDTAGRPLRSGIEKPNLAPLEQIKTLDEDFEFVSENREALISRFQKILEQA